MLLALPTGFEDALQYQEAQRCIAEVLSVDDSSIVDTGLVRSGEQRCTVRFTNGTFKGQTATAINLLLTTLVIALVYGFDKRCASAVSGSFLGILVTMVLSVIFTDLFKIHGAVMAYSESLLYAGFQHLNLTHIFMASIFLGSSGAVMDLSVDITFAVHEVVKKKLDIKPREAVKSGMNVGRAATRTMTTMLLLAYSGGYIALLMVFMTQGIPVEHIFNYKYVSAEIIHTIVGSFGLVSVAPFTALCADFMLTKKK